eukprot:2069451-Pyramimonas_sp.AAC.2
MRTTNRFAHLSMLVIVCGSLFRDADLIGVAGAAAVGPARPPPRAFPPGRYGHGRPPRGGSGPLRRAPSRVPPLAAAADGRPPAGGVVWGRGGCGRREHAPFLSGGHRRAAQGPRAPAHPAREVPRAHHRAAAYEEYIRPAEYRPTEKRRKLISKERTLQAIQAFQADILGAYANIRPGAALACALAHMPCSRRGAMNTIRPIIK